ncbi:MAG: efflux RND transporter periplasmic adaptor subunit [Candidatus Pacebacteria bacterium]|nr:efflux RND transporter periplasmic adaptor subunit [Candidatus Paceibacterota bacterium]
MKKILNPLKKNFKSKTRIFLAIIVVLAGVIFFRQRSKNDKPQIINQTATAKRGTIVSSITASGKIISSNIENITTQASGTVSRVYVSDGDEVSAGQKLVEINLDVQGKQNYASAYSNYLSAQNSLNSANNNYRSARASLEVVYDEIKGHDSDETLEMKEQRTRAEVAHDNAYDAIKNAEAKLNSTALAYKTTAPVITSPVAGIVKSVTIAEGMNIGASETASGARANQRVATISTGGLPIATFNVSEIDVSQIKPGQKTTITLDSVSGKTFTGKVVSVDRVGTITSNVTNYPVIIQFDTSTGQILPNMAATASIIVQTKSDILIVPSTAINYQGETAAVVILKDGQKTNQTVEVGISSDIETEIISGLSEGEVVITGTISVPNQSAQNRSNGVLPFGPAAGGGSGRMMMR